MVLVFNGVMQDDCPMDTATLFMQHPVYRDYANQLLSIPTKTVSDDVLNCVFLQPPLITYDHGNKNRYIYMTDVCYLLQVGPVGVLYVGQREMAAVGTHDKNVSIIGSDDVTTCIIVVVRHSGSGAVALAHFDGNGMDEAVSIMVSRVQNLALGYPEGRLELQMIGGYKDQQSYAEDLFVSIMRKYKCIFFKHFFRTPNFSFFF